MKKSIIFVFSLMAVFVTINSYALSGTYTLPIYVTYPGQPPTLASHAHIKFTSDKEASFQGWDSGGLPIGSACPWVNLSYNIDPSNNITFTFNGVTVLKGNVINANTINIAYYGGSGVIYQDPPCQVISNGGANTLVSGSYTK